MNAHRITIGKSDEPALVAEKIIDAKTEVVLLTIPRFSKLAESEHNFSLLKREAESSGTQLLIESIDDDVLKICKNLGIECFNPFFGDPPKQFADITPGKTTTSDSHVELVASRSSRARAGGGASRVAVRSSKRVNQGRFSKKTILLFVALFVVVSGFVFGFTMLPRADIKIIATKASWDFKDSIEIDKDISAFDPKAFSVPGQVFFQNKNLQLSFPAAGKKNVSQKATGLVTLFNNHSSESQPLVATTRLETPDGKIFRLVKSIVVPGATVAQGTVSKPGSIRAEVIADKAGESYNIGPIERFTIPGFAGSPKFKSFYASSDLPMAGGFVGEASYPTDAELTEAKETASRTLEESIRALVRAQLPSGFTLVEGATLFEVNQQVVNPSSGSNGTFSISTDGSLTLMLFKESDVLSMLHEAFAVESGSGFDVRSETLKYGVPQFKIESGSISSIDMPVDYEAVFAKHVDVEDLKERIAGKTEDEVKPLLFSISGLESAQVSLWPFWVRSVPSSEKVTITVD